MKSLISIGIIVVAGTFCGSAFAQTPNSIFFHPSAQRDASAAALGDVAAHVRLGYQHLTGSARTVDPAQAAQHFAAAGQSGSLAASAWLGYTYVLAPRLGHQAAEGVSLIQAAANRGDPVAQTLLGRIQDRGLAPGVLRQDHGAAQKLLEAAAPHFALASTYLGESYLRLKNADGYAKAQRLFLSAADADEPNAMTALAKMYSMGLGVPKNAVQSFQWLQRAVQWGDPAAIFQLGYFYRHAPGRLNDPQKATAQYLQAALAGYVPAQTALGLCYAEGVGVSRDINQAVIWLSKAAPYSTFAAAQLAALSTHRR